MRPPQPRAGKGRFHREIERSLVGFVLRCGDTWPCSVSARAVGELAGPGPPERVLDARALAFLAEASAVLASSSTTRRRWHAWRNSPSDLADWCVVDLIEGEGVRRVAVVCADRQQERGRARAPRPAVSLIARTGTPHVLRTGEPELLSEVSDEWRVDRDGSRPARAAARTGAAVEPDRSTDRQDADDRRAHDRHRRVRAHVRRRGSRDRRGSPLARRWRWTTPGCSGTEESLAVLDVARDRAGGAGVLGPEPPLRPDQRHARGAQRPAPRSTSAARRRTYSRTSAAASQPISCVCSRPESRS